MTNTQSGAAKRVPQLGYGINIQVEIAIAALHRAAWAVVRPFRNLEVVGSNPGAAQPGPPLSRRLGGRAGRNNQGPY